MAFLNSIVAGVVVLVLALATIVLLPLFHLSLFIFASTLAAAANAAATVVACCKQFLLKKLCFQIKVI